MPDPKLPENGAVDSKADHPNYYYRLFVVLENGQYFFTRSKRPGSHPEETPAAVAADKADESTVDAPADNTRLLVMAPADDREKTRIKSPVTIRRLPELSLSNTVFIRKGDTLLGQISASRIQSYRDSILRRTKDTLVFVDGDTRIIRPFVAKGNIQDLYPMSIRANTAISMLMLLPQAANKHFAVKFFDENKKLLFELSEIRDPALIVDKTNLLQSFRMVLFRAL